jgi:hypothetical protein
MKKHFIVIIFALGIISQLYAPSQQITVPGSYLYGEDVTYSPVATNDSIIQISTNNVTFDLGGRIFTQGNLIAGLNGIIVDPNLTNIIIRNGYIQNITGTGIGIGQGCSRITIDNIVTFSCDLRGMNLGGATGTPITDSEVKNCSLLSCCQGATGDFGLRLFQCSRVKVTNCNINNNGLSSHALSSVRVNTCLQCDFQGVNVLSNIGTAVVGFDIVTSSTCLFGNCLVRNNTALGAGLTMTAFAINGTGNAFNVFNNCMSFENAAPAANPSQCFSFDLSNNSFANLFIACKAIGNTAAAVNGFNLTGPTNVINNSFIDCIAQRNNATGASAGSAAAGFAINNTADFGMILRCVSSFNTSTNDSAYGLLFQGGTGGSNWSIRESEFVRNIGSGNATSFGINIIAGTTNMFSKNTAFNNGTTQGNQMSGVPVSTVFNRNTTNLNNNGAGSGPWGNVDIIP